MGKTFSVRSENGKAIIDHLKGISYDGGTQLGGLFQSDEKQLDVYLLFSDGMSTFGVFQPQVPSVPVYALSDSLGVNAPLLRWLSQSSGSEYINLKTMETNQVLSALGASSFRLLSTEVVEGDV